MNFNGENKEIWERYNINSCMTIIIGEKYKENPYTICKTEIISNLKVKNT